MAKNQYKREGEYEVKIWIAPDDYGRAFPWSWSVSFKSTRPSEIGEKYYHGQNQFHRIGGGNTQTKWGAKYEVDRCIRRHKKGDLSEQYTIKS